MRHDPQQRHWSARTPLVIGLTALVVLLGGFGTWSTQSTLAGAIVAQGQLEVDQNRQVVQHPDGGVVERVMVEEGDVVAAGDVLLTLDATLLRSELNAVEGQYYEILARRARLAAERDGADTLTIPDELTEAAQTTPLVSELIEGQRRLFQARRDSMEQRLDQLEKRKQQTASQIEGIAAQEAAIAEQIALMEQELAAQQSLLDRQLAQSSRVLSLQREAAQLQGRLGELVAAGAEAEGRITELEIEMLKLTSERREEAISRLRDLRYREVELAETRSSLRERLARLEIRAPVGGVIYGLTVFAPRSVIRAADAVLYIVPQDRPLVVSSRIKPMDVDEVFVGQQVNLRFPVFDSRSAPELQGHVTKVSADAFTDEGSRASFYRAEIRLADPDTAEYAALTLIPGMPVEAFIQTAERTPLQYLLDPLTSYFARAFRES
jgi:HlyD family secretion protein